ncbi:MAG: hypothetical protein HYU73_22425 [Betaproteobacteria bacterium]|nr:hypothetical protein [Betaproteobacteria bacterium]
MHDTIEFEKRGIPATTIVTEAFRKTAVFQFRAKGMDGHPVILLPHPVSNLSSDAMHEVTLRYVDELVRQLTG